MSGEAEAGDVGHRAGVRGEEDRGLGQRLGHAVQAGGDRLAEDQAGQAGHRHLGCKDRAGAKRFGQDQRAAGGCPRLGHRVLRKAGHGEADRQFRPDAGVATDDIGSGGGEDGTRRRHDLGQHVRVKGGCRAGQGDLCKRRLRGRPHRPDIAERVDRGQRGHPVRVVGEGAQVVGGDDLHARPMRQHCRIVAGSGQHIGAGWGGKGRQRRLQRTRADLRPAPAAQRARADRLGEAKWRGLGQGRGRHRREIRELRHEPGVNAVLQPPQPAAPGPQAELVGYCTPVTQRDQFQVIALRLIPPHRPPGQRGAQVVVQDGCLPHGVDPRLGARRVAHMGCVARGKHHRVRRLERRPDRDEPLVQLQPGVGQPVLRPRACHRQGEIRRHPPPVRQNQVVEPHLGRGDAAEHLDPGFRQFGQETVASRRVQPRQRLCSPFQHRHNRTRACLAQPVRGGQSQLDPAHPAAQNDHGWCVMALCHEIIPPRGIIAQRLGGLCMKAKPRQVGQIRRDPDIKARHVVAHRPPPRQQHPVARLIEPHRPIKDQPRPGEPCQPHEVDHQHIAAIVSGDLPGQHPGIGGGGVGIDQRQPHAGQGFHPPHPQHQCMRMPAADQHQIAHKRQGGRVHRAPLRPPWPSSVHKYPGGSGGLAPRPFRKTCAIPYPE